MITTPDIKRIEWTEEDRFIVIASREVYDLIPNHEMDELMRICINMQPSGMATYIRDIALLRGASRNITVAIMNLEQYADAKILASGGKKE